MVGNSYDALGAAFGAALRHLRHAAGLTQEQLGQDAGIQRNFVSLIETGQNQHTLPTLSKLAHALGLSASALVAEAESELRKPRRA